MALLGSAAPPPPQTRGGTLLFETHDTPCRLAADFLVPPAGAPGQPGDAILNFTPEFKIVVTRQRAVPAISSNGGSSADGPVHDLESPSRDRIVPKERHPGFHPRRHPATLRSRKVISQARLRPPRPADLLAPSSSPDKVDERLPPSAPAAAAVTPRGPRSVTCRAWRGSQ